ncbi:MAG TPA: SDR family oxidoreductase [Fibrobacteria bacterium]|nr:SDR family oxidoreductase [Fibrobacteria bacterium]
MRKGAPGAKPKSARKSSPKATVPAKVALVTGSAKRLGRELALRIGSLGYFTWIHYRSSRAEAAAVLAEIEAEGGRGALVKGDMASSRDVAAIAAKLGRASGRLDLLVNNVGIYLTGDLLGYRVEDFEATLQTNLVGAYHLIARSLDLFPGEGGAIVNIGYSGVGSLTASTHNTAYLISKTGLLVLTKSLAQALGPRGIRVNMVSPGILDNSVELPKRPREYIPLGRLGRCRDVCDAVEFLAGSGSAYVTGVNLDVAGGYMLGLKELDVDRGT